MNKLKVTLLLGLISISLLSGCGHKDSSPAPQSGETSNAPASSEDATYSLTPPAEGMVRSRITNEWVDAEVDNTRPVAIMIPNSSTASFYGLSKASVLYECNVEGSMTRLMGIFEDWEDSPKLGNIRSCRDYFVYWAFEWDAIYIHYGGPFYIDDVIERDDTQNINCLTYPNASFRDEAKDSTDNAFISGSSISEAMGQLGYSKNYRAGYADNQHYKFAPVDSPNTLEQYPSAIDAVNIDMSDTYPVTNCYFVYNEETGLYDRYQHLPGMPDGPHIDEENGKQLAFKNVLVQNTYHEVRDEKGYLAFQVHDEILDGWYFTNGRGIHVNWAKLTDYGATRYYDDAGNEISLNPGKTMVLIVENGDTFKVNNSPIKSNK